MTATMEAITTTASPFLTPDEIAQRLRLDRTTVYEWLRKGELPAYRFGWKWRVHQADYAAWERQYRLDQR